MHPALRQSVRCSMPARSKATGGPSRTCRRRATIGLGRGPGRGGATQVGLVDVASQRICAFSLGMRQRLGIALALLGDPPVVMLDEPINGLDPDGVMWVRHLLRSLADQGRTVFVSSHLMSEVPRTPTTSS